jgi:hydroxyacylglutathione hydrolase
MHITPVPCLRDNYAYLVHATGSKECVIVDPSEAGPVARALDGAGLRPIAILNTHHHWDHVGGNEELVARYGALRVYGHRSDQAQARIPGQTHAVDDAGEFEEAGMHFRVMHIPGHTLGAVAYISAGAVFTGDTLFCAGCGRLFEGTPAQMYESLNVKLGSLPADTRVYCGHEYTESNLRFAAHVEPNNPDVELKAQRVAELRARGEPTVPSTLSEEKRTNPFMRCDSPEIIQSVAARLGADRSAAAILGAVRAAKDAF